MPFDFIPQTLSEPTTVDPHALYRERREAAVRLWATVPPERFDIKTWACGSTACALGELSARGHDGWSKLPPPHGDANSFLPARGQKWGFYAAAEFFGLPFKQAEKCFTSFGYRKPSSEITLADVSARLLAAPYTS